MSTLTDPTNTASTASPPGGLSGIRALPGLLVAIETMQGQMAQVLEVLAELRSRPVGVVDRPAPVTLDRPAVFERTFYSVEEASKIINKSTYTVREYCRLGQCNAVKRAERRGKGSLWSISAAEVSRIKNEGLLPMDLERNNRN